MPMEEPRKAPRWLVALSSASVVATFGCFLAAAAYSQITSEPWPPPLYVRLVSAAIVSFGIAFGSGLIYSVVTGTYYSGLAGRWVTRQCDPLHFWLLLGAIGVLPVALIVYGVCKFSMAS